MVNLYPIMRKTGLITAFRCRVAKAFTGKFAKNSGVFLGNLYIYEPYN